MTGLNKFPLKLRNLSLSLPQLLLLSFQLLPLGLQLLHFGLHFLLLLYQKLLQGLNICSPFSRQLKGLLAVLVCLGGCDNALQKEKEV